MSDKPSEASLAEVLAIDPVHQGALRAMADLAFRRHDHSAVIHWAERALAVIPSDPQLLALRRNAQLLHRPAPAPVAAARILMLSRTVPGTSVTAGRYMQSFIDLLPRGHLGFFCLSEPQRFDLPADLAWLPIAFAPYPALTGNAGSYRAASVECSQRIARDVVFFAQNQGMQRIFVLMTPALFGVIQEIRAISSIPISLIVVDPPDYQLNSLQITPELHRPLLEDFARAQRIADRCATVSEAMAGVYESAYGHKPIILRHAIAEEMQGIGRQAPHRDDALTIALVGGMYAADAIAAFIGALDEAAWTIAGRRVSLICLTHPSPPGSTPSMPIEHLGWLDQNEAVRALARADLGYIPYWFDDQFRSAVTLSFPSKLSLMAAAGIPVFFHGPSHASVASFLEWHPMGCACFSMEARDITSQLCNFLAVPERYAAASAASETAFRGEMSHSTFRSRLLELAGSTE